MRRSKEKIMITILAIGKNKDKSMESIEAEYLKRLSAFSQVRVTEVKDESNAHSEREAEAALIKEREGKRALEKIKENDFVILLDLHGKEWTSEEFAAQLDTWQQSGRNTVFVIAGSLGPSPALTARADVRWKLSDLTFTHLMTRMLVLEQIYRGFTIIHHRSYHK